MCNIPILPNLIFLTLIVIITIYKKTAADSFCNMASTEYTRDSDEYDSEEYDSKEYDSDGWYKSVPEKSVPEKFVDKFGQPRTCIDPAKASKWLETCGYVLTFAEARELDDQYAHWDSDDNAEIGTHWLAAFDFPKVGDVVEIDSTEYKVKWTGILTMAIEPVQ